MLATIRAENEARVHYLNRAHRHRGMIHQVLERRYGPGVAVTWYGFGLHVVTASGAVGCAPTLRGACAIIDERVS